MKLSKSFTNTSNSRRRHDRYRCVHVIRLTDEIFWSSYDVVCIRSTSTGDANIGETRYSRLWMRWFLGPPSWTLRLGNSEHSSEHFYNASRFQVNYFYNFATKKLFCMFSISMCTLVQLIFAPVFANKLKSEYLHLLPCLSFLRFICVPFLCWRLQTFYGSSSQKLNC